MNVIEFANIFSSSGIKVRKSGKCYFTNQGWINYSFPNLYRFPIHHIIHYTQKWKYLITIILTDSKIKNTYEFILQTDNYNIENFASKIRNRIRKSLQNCKFKRPTLEDMIHYGLKINQDTCRRQRRKDKTLTSFKHWRKCIKSFYFHDNIIILGAYYANRMVGYITVYELEGTYIIHHAYIDKQYSGITAPMNGLIYTMVNKLIKQNGSVKISYGLDSFVPLPNLNRFKQNMLFERLSATRIYIINPLLLPFIKLIIYINVHLFKRRSIKSSFLRKVIHLYQGNRILTKNAKTTEYI